MIFVKFTYSNDVIFMFCLDDLVTCETEKWDKTKIELKSGRQEILDIEINDFCAEVFSDQYGDKEYTLIEIESNDSETDNVMGANLTD